MAIRKFATAYSLSGQIDGLGRTVSIPRLPNEKQVCGDCTGLYRPRSTSLFRIHLSVRDNQSAGIAYQSGDYRTFVMGFPLRKHRVGQQTGPQWLWRQC